MNATWLQCQLEVLKPKKEKVSLYLLFQLARSLQQVYLFAYESVPCHESAAETSKLLDPLLARSQFILIFGVHIFVQSLKEIEIIS